MVKKFIVDTFGGSSYWGILKKKSKHSISIEKATKVGSKKYSGTLLADIMYDTVEQILIEKSDSRDETTILKWLVRF